MKWCRWYRGTLELMLPKQVLKLSGWYHTFVSIESCGYETDVVVQWCVFLCSRYLEHQLSSITDPYEIAITAYALTLCDSIEKEFAFSLLHSKRLEVAGMIKFVSTQKHKSCFQTWSSCCYLWVFRVFQKLNNLQYKKKKMYRIILIKKL